ncbi:hypothetical protein Pla123a_23520 [Posidoniimonas polymericola]|uniref:Glycosyltransferase RgtA/B/C/D-like domain-containing protein n=1 Tax=Posidoniimonas polymericola TaxID=2528002 RepID=A0A5C5YQ83_9BACT|nr:hypothetical protein [Posidoniimonas polymericola]TWT76927.1 hypothetical protein Pla123a_23520 [Posidoniimonas polymericola]
MQETPGGSPNSPLLADARLRWSLYTLLIAVAIGQWSGRILAVNSVDNARLESYRISQRLNDFRQDLADRGLSAAEIEETSARKRVELEEKLALQRPFLSSNDRSRWVAMRALVEGGTFAIDDYVSQPGWDTIDKVRHKDQSGELHYYSSKPPLLYIMLAGEYWLINKATGWTLGDEPYAVGRLMLLTFSVAPFALMLTLVAALAERFCESLWARLYVVACASFGTMLTAFAVVLNNHLFAAVSAALAAYAWVRVRESSAPQLRWFILAGLAAAFTAANELPALAMLVGIGLSLLVRWPRATLVAYAPAALLVMVAFFATTYYAHGSLKPPYMHRDEENVEDNWYRYPNSHWNDPQGMDAGEQCKGVYTLHALVGHHGLFSMTPIWLLAAAGAGAWLITGSGLRRELAFGVTGLTVVVLVFYLGLRPQVDRNYGGMTNGLRWMFWFSPLWLAVMSPAADWASRTAVRRAGAMVLLAFSALSAAYPTWNPWTQPWIYNWMQWCGFELLG